VITPTRLFVLALAVCMAIATQPACAQTRPDGVWSGSYTCAQGETGATMAIESTSGGGLRAILHFYPTQTNAAPAEGCFTLTGRFNPSDRSVNLVAGQWLMRPPNYVTADVNGRLSENGQHLDGNVLVQSCTTFALYRVEGDYQQVARTCNASAPPPSTEKPIAPEKTR
jgi:hypothetical protein